MKIFLIVCLLITFVSCKNEKNLKTEQKLIETENKKSELKEFSNTEFKDRAEELVYIREYLNNKLPLILISKEPEQMKRIQYELISRGENPTIEEAAKRSLHFRNLYEPYMTYIISENIKFKTVKQELETNGKLNFLYSKTENLIYIPQEKTKQEIITKKDTVNIRNEETNIALENLLQKRNKNNDPNLNSSKRTLTYKETPEYNCSEEGKVTIEVEIDKNGNVLKAFKNYKGTTTNSKCLIDASLKAASNSKWNKDENGPEIQIANITYNFNTEE